MGTDIINLIFLALPAMVPITLTAVGEIFGERAGMVNIGLEGIMLISAFTGVIGADFSGSPIVGLLAGLGTGAVIGLLHGVIGIYLKGDQIISGVGINIFALGFVAFGLIAVWKVAGYHQVPKDARVPALFHNTRFGDLSPMVIVTLVIAVAVYFILNRTVIGLRVKAVGENPEAADVAGIKVERVRLMATVFGAALAGLAGAYLSVDWIGSITRQLPAGRGFIALATVVFSRLNPLLAVAGGFIFGFFWALGLWVQNLPDIIVPYQFVQMLPYVATLVVVAGVIGRARFPSAIAQPYRRE
ncbi:MAG: ABC transporter permease [Candidatus Bipolaricaulia bacterium]